MYGIIYKITNIINGKIYIGQTIRSKEERWYYHVYDATIQKSKTKIGRAIRKYGPEAFIIEILEETENLDEREKFYISHYKSNTKGYNIKLGGNGGPHSDRTKKRIAKANSKRIWTKEMRDNMSIAIKKWHNERGFVPRSEDFKKKISEANRHRKMPLKTKEKFQAYNKSQMCAIICINNNKEYESIAEAARKMKLNEGQLGQHLKGKHKHVKGFIFRRK